MRKKLSLFLLALLTSMGAWAGIVTDRASAGDPMTFSQFQALAGTGKHFAIVGVSDNTQFCYPNWFGFTATFGSSMTTAYLFDLEESATDGDWYNIKRVSDDQYVSTEGGNFAATPKMDFALVNRTPGDYHSSFSATNFISLDNAAGKHYNCNTTNLSFQGGTGGYSVYAAYGPFYVVTVNCINSSTSETIQTLTYVVTDGTIINAPQIANFISNGGSVTVNGADAVLNCNYTAISTSNVAGKTFTLQCARGYVYYNGTQLAGTNTAANASKFAIVSYDNNTYLYDVTNNAFVCHTTAATAGNTGNAALESNNDFSKIAKNISFGSTNIAAYPYYVQEDEFTNWLNMDGGPRVYLNRWTNFENGNGGNTYKIAVIDTDFDQTDAAAMLDAYFNPSATVTYVISDGSGVIYTSEAVGATVGDNVTTLPSDLQRPYCTYSVTSTTVVAGNNNVPVTVTYAPPFTVSSDFNTATWYYATLRGKQLRADESHKDGSDRYQTNSTNERTDVYKWAFVGNPYNLSIINKGAGSSKCLYMGTQPVMQAATPASDNKARWIVSSNSNGGFTVRSESGANLYINDAGNEGDLGYWNSTAGANDGGSNWVVSEVTASDKALLGDAIAAAQALVAGTGVPGYPIADAASTLSGAITTAQGVYDNPSGDYVSAYNTLAAAIATATTTANINYTPRTDVYYTITSTRGSMVYDSSHDSSTDAEGNKYLWYTTSLDNTNPNHLWGFIEQDGHYYMYNVGKKQFATVGTGTYGSTWIFSDTPAYVTFDAGINNSVAAPYVRVRATVATTGTTYSMSISTSYTGPVITYDAQGDGGIPMVIAESSVAVDADITAEMTAKVEDLTPYKNALKSVIDACASISIGTGLNQYASNSTYTDALAAANTAYNNASATKSELQTATSNLETAIAGLSINLPATGKFYRIKGYSNNYITSGDLNYYATMNATTSANNIIYYSADNNLIFFGSGYGLYQTCKIAPAGSTLNTFTFSQGAQMGHYYVRSNYSGGGQYCYDHEGSDAGDILNRYGSPVTSGNYNTDWTLEEVTTLPITMRTPGNGDNAYYGTIMLPVAVTIPDGLKAYKAAASGDMLTLTKAVADDGTGVLAANQPVILYSTSNVETLAISDAAGTSADDNELLGTIAAATVEANATYVLSYNSASNKVGFYKYNDTTMPGFKAYLPASATANNVKGFTFSFEDIEDAIRAIESEDSSLEIYDIAGRRVQKAQKGLYIVNGKKVMYK